MWLMLYLSQIQKKKRVHAITGAPRGDRTQLDVCVAENKVVPRSRVAYSFPRRFRDPVLT